MAFKDLHEELAELLEEETSGAYFKLYAPELGKLSDYRAARHRRRVKAFKAEQAIDCRLRRKRNGARDRAWLAAQPRAPKVSYQPASPGVVCRLCRTPLTTGSRLTEHWRSRHPEENQAASLANRRTAATAQKLDRRAAPPRLEPVRVGKGALAKVAYYRTPKSA